MNDERCPDCTDLGRRDFFRAAGAAAIAGVAAPLWATAKDATAPTPHSAAETAVKGLFESLTDEQRKAMCFAWDHVDAQRKMKLREVVSANWQITPHHVISDFYTKKQQHLIHDVFKGLVHPEWYTKFEKEIKDDCGGPFGCDHSIAIFGTPGAGPFEMVLTGRHMTLRADGNSTDQAAFGGPIFYGHQGENDKETGKHPGNVFWPQALAANKVYTMLDGKQRKAALLETKRPGEGPKNVAHRGGKGKAEGLAASEMSADQKAELQKVLTALIEPFRAEDCAEVQDCLKRQGGLDGCHLAFYRDGDIDNDEVWDNWKLEGPRFCWWFRGQPHVHVWVNVAG